MFTEGFSEAGSCEPRPKESKRGNGPEDVAKVSTETRANWGDGAGAQRGSWCEAECVKEGGSRQGQALARNWGFSPQ